MKMDLETRISDVTVFRDGARLTRSGSLRIETGEHHIIASGITGYAMSDSFRVKGKGAAVLKAIDVSKKQVIYEPKADVDKMVKELEKLQKEQKKITDKLEFYESRVGHLSTIRSQFASEIGKWIAVGESSVKHFADMDETSISLLRELKTKIQNERTQLEELQFKIRVAQSNLNKIQGQRRTETITEVKVLVEAKQATEIQLDITYQIRYAGWSPTYDVDIGEKNASLKRIAMVYNNSLESWEDVTLIVSTSSARPVEAVTPKPYYVNIASAVAVSTGFGFMADKERDYDEMPEEAEEYVGAADGLEDLIEIHSTASETLSGTVIYDVPGKVTIASEQDPHPITLTEEEFDSRKLYYWNAAAMPEVVAQDEITNGDSVILPGNVKVYAQGEFIGETSLGMIAPREEFRLGTRAAYDVKAEKKLIAKDTEKAGITRGKRRRDYQYRLEIKSFAKTSINMKVVDVIPHSSSEKVEIELSQPTHEYKKFELGILEWETNIETNEQLKIEYGFTIQWDKDLRLRPPLP